MFSKVYGGDVHGIDARLIQVEADVTDGLPMFSMVGHLSSSVREAKERVRASLKNLGIRFPAKRITINLSPADLKKEGNYFDLPIAVSLLAAFDQINPRELTEYVLIGELSLDGKVKKVRGVLPIVMEARKHGIMKCVVPYENVSEAKIVTGITVIGIKKLSDLFYYFRGEKGLPKEENEQKRISNKQSVQELDRTEKLDFSDVYGQEGAKMAIEIAAAGMHNLLLMGPPGTGKTMLAKRIPYILPELTYEESLEITRIYSVCGLLESGLIKKRPFRAPHHTVTPSALIGGGRNGKPGEITLATGGVLFLDEFLEFPGKIIDLLRQPMEEKKVSVNRLEGSFIYPADIMLVAASNPCKCGYFPDVSKCKCSPGEVRSYLGKLSEPILDRMDTVSYTHLRRRRWVTPWLESR